MPVLHRGIAEYGYLWWVTDYPYRGRTVRVCYAGGGRPVRHHRPPPQLDLVIATYGASYSSGKATHAISRDLTKNHILAAVGEGRR